MKRALLLFLLAVPAFADSVNTKERTVTKLADGVFAIRHPDAPDGFPQGNTTVIIGSRDVLVVDSCYYPVSAREDIAQIRQWTDKPVRYLVNTHWHYDHTMGNGEYAKAFPQLQIVAHRETKKSIEGYNPGWFARFPARKQRFQQRLDTGKADDGRALTEVEQKDLRNALAGYDLVQKEFDALVDRAPNVGFDDDLTIDLGNRIVRIAHLGRGNTAGDAIVFLPAEKIVVAGDLLDHPVPYLGGGYPVDLVTTLGELAQLDFTTVVPGHGEVLQGKEHLRRVTAFVRAITDQVSAEIYRVGNGSRNLEAVQKAVMEKVDIDAFRRQFAGDDPDNRDFFDTFALPGVITAAYAQLWGR